MALKRLGTTTAAPLVCLSTFLLLAPVAADEDSDLRLMDLSVVALDSHGEPVTDLTAGDFRVTDAGKPQKIEFFRHNDSKPWKTPALGPGELSNRAAGNVPRATVILFDLLNEDFSSRGNSANQLVRTLEGLETADNLYLYLLTLDGRLHGVHAVPGPGTEATPPDGSPWTRQIKPVLDQALRDVLQTRRPDIDIAVRTQLTFHAMSSMAVELSRVPGRKNLVWVTDGVPIELGPNRSDTGDFVDFTPLLRQMSEALDRSGVAIYPVRQVMIGSPDNVNGANRSGIGSIDTLSQFADLTGGRPDTGKDIGSALRQALSDMRTSYQIGYYPPAGNWDNKFHKLRVTTTRKGIKLQAKSAYYAWKEPPGARAEQAINTAMQTQFDAAEIGVRGHLSPGKGANALHLDARIDARDIVLVPAGDRYSGQLRLALVGDLPGGQPQGGPTIPLDLHYTAAERERALQDGIAFSQDVTFPAPVSALRLIVFDRGSNTVGSLTLPVPK